MLTKNCTEKRLLSIIVIMRREISESADIAHQVIRQSKSEDIVHAMNQQLDHFEVMLYILHALMRMTPVNNVKIKNEQDA